MYFHKDTIVSRVTPEIRSSVGIIRVSGTLAMNATIKILGKKIPNRYATYLPFLDANGLILDKGIALWFSSPSSFTGEDVLELHGHGNPVIIDSIIDVILSISGIRLAKPGEFSERAFLNGKIDLIQAESIADLINADSNQAARAALQSLEGTFSNYINNLIMLIKKLRVTIEASINFSEEECTDRIKYSINEDLKKIIKRIQEINLISIKGCLLNEGVKVVISGDPNSGKSSLLNGLSLVDRSIVTNVPGTTRDVIYEKININGIVFRLADTAGFRETSNIIENMGIKRAWKEVNSADHVLFVIDGTLSDINQSKSYDNFIKSFLNNGRLTIIFNKCDDDQFTINSDLCNLQSSIVTAACKGIGIEKLRTHLYKSLKFDSVMNYQEGIFLARRRHVNIISKVLKIMNKSKTIWMLYSNLELLAEDLKVSQNYLGEITGLYSTNQLLSDIFSNFCIGK